jgi:hypothetical protein
MAAASVGHSSVISSVTEKGGRTGKGEVVLTVKKREERRE